MEQNADAFLSDVQPSAPSADDFLSGPTVPLPTGGANNAENIEPGVYGQTDPPEQQVLEKLVTVAQGYGAGKLAAGATNLIGSLFTSAPDLLNAGIKGSTIAKMVPNGVNPADFGEQLQDTLNSEGALGDDARSTWDNIYKPNSGLLAKGNQELGNAMNDIVTKGQQSGVQNPLAVDSQKALQPLVDQWANRASGALNATTRTAQPFEKIYGSLANQAAQNGGLTTLNHIDSAMSEVGPLTHSGPQAMQEAHSALYATLANVRDNIIKNIADNSGDPDLGQNLLDANAKVSRYLRIMPDITNASAQAPIKEGVSTFQKLGGPTIAKMGASYLGAQGIHDYVKSLMGGDQR